MSWRFYPLAEFPTCGLLQRNGLNPIPAEFLTPEKAKALQQRKKADAA
jgi:hypothetical protein